MHNPRMPATLTLQNLADYPEGTVFASDAPVEAVFEFATTAEAIAAAFEFGDEFQATVAS